MIIYLEDTINLISIAALESKNQANVDAVKALLDSGEHKETANGIMYLKIT